MHNQFYYIKIIFGIEFLYILLVKSYNTEKCFFLSNEYINITTFQTDGRTDGQTDRQTRKPMWQEFDSYQS